MSMNLTLKLPSGESRNISVDENISASELKEMCCREAFTSPAFTKVTCDGKALFGEKLAEEFGVHDGSEIVITVKGL